VVFLVGFFVNMLALKLTATLMGSGFDVDSWWAAFIGGLVLAAINTILSLLFDLDDDNSFYDNLVQRLAVRRAGTIEKGEGRGLVIIEIDGLSYWHIQKAIADGYMPNMKRMIDEDGYKISRVDCGLPATTPACQAGILLGNNQNIPAFRWLDKSTGKLLAGGQAAAIVEPELSNGQGLLRGGSSIGNMFSGDAAKAILTFSRLKANTPEENKRRAQDIFLLMVNPYFFMRTLVLFFGDVFVELWQGFQQRRKNVQPRLNRLHNGYPFLRAATTVFLRDVTAYLTILDIVRGVPAMYMLYAGYDEVAHHSGPWTTDAMKELGKFDKIMGRILKVMETRAPRAYEFLLLSDHGQSFGPTFEQRYGIAILDFIKEHLPAGTSAVATFGGDDGTLPVGAMMGELQNIQDNQMGGMVGNAVVNTTARAIQSNLDQQPGAKDVKPAKVTLCYSGNLAQVYFDLFPRRILLSELNAAYPGMVDALVQHEGIGFVIAYDDDGEPIAFGKNGARNLSTGDVVGEDPLLPFGDVELRTRQLKRIADFENAGDLTLNSTIYPDGSVAALEELIGNHGGLGGEQTDAFILHPMDMVVPETYNSYEFMAILDSRRGLPGVAQKPDKPAVVNVNPWALPVLGKGLSQVGRWISLALRAVVLNRDAYREIAHDAYMTGPALLLILIGQTIQSVVRQGEFDLLTILLRTGLFFLAVILLQLTARVLRGKASITSTLNVVGFAQTAHLVQLLAFVPVIGPVANFLANLLVFLGIWVGVSSAHELKGWRTFVLPVIYLVVAVVSFVFLVAILEGIQFTATYVFAQLGLVSAP
jgi:hypothetical protein